MPARSPKLGAGSSGAADTVPKKRKVSQADSEKKGGGVSFEVYHSEAGTFQSIGEFKKAINSYGRALELRPTDKNCLISRAQCYLQLGEADKALSDANETLKQDAHYIKGLQMKAEAYYLMMQFEYALMFYHRGFKLRPEVQAFRLGIQKSQEAIENCIGENAGIHLENKGDLSFFYSEQQQKKSKKVTIGYTKAVTKTEEKVERRQRTACTDSKTVKELLGELYTDKEYLEKLLRETESASNQSETNKAIRTLAIRGLDYLDTRTEFWQQQKPMYSRKRDRKMRENARGQNSGIDKSKDPIPWVVKNLEEIDEAQSEGRYEDSLKQAKRVLKEVERWSDKDVKNRNEMMANVHSLLGNAYLETGNYPRALDCHSKDYDIAFKHNLPDAKSRALDNLGRVNARMGNFDKAIEVWLEKLPLSKSALESTWLHHEIGRCYLELGCYDDAKDYGEKSLSAAEEADDGLWQLNASVLIAQADVKLGELDAAIDSFNRALELAKVQSDRAAESAVRRAIDDINNTMAKQTRQIEQKDRSNSDAEYILRVFTGDKLGAGTDSKVYVTLFGEHGDSGERYLKDSDQRNPFERSQEDVFRIIVSSDLGEIKRVKIRQDNSGMMSAWYLDRIEIEHAPTGKRTSFICNNWLADGEGDGLIERELTSEDSHGSGKDDDLVSPPSRQSDSNAGDESSPEPGSAHKEQTEENGNKDNDKKAGSLSKGGKK